MPATSAGMTAESIPSQLRRPLHLHVGREQIDIAVVTQHAEPARIEVEIAVVEAERQIAVGEIFHRGQRADGAVGAVGSTSEQIFEVERTAPSAPAAVAPRHFLFKSRRGSVTFEAE